MNKNFIPSLIFLCLLFLPLFSFATSINLYEEPKNNAKVVSTLDSNVGMIPIFTPEKGDWIKVADPRNGNVGWVKVSDLGNAKTTEYTFTQRFINTGASPQTYQIIQFGGPQKMTPEQVQTLLKQTEMQQLQIQQNMNKAMQNMMNDMNNLYQWNRNWFNNGAPFIMPVLVIPSQNAPTPVPTPPKGSNSSKSSK